MFGIGIAADHFHVTADANRWRVTRFILQRSTVNLLQLGVIDIHTKRIFDGLKIGFVAICRDLDAAPNAVLQRPS